MACRHCWFLTFSPTLKNASCHSSACCDRAPPFGRVHARGAGGQWIDGPDLYRLVLAATAGHHTPIPPPMNYERLFALIDRAYAVAWAACGAFTGLVASAVAVLFLRGDDKLVALYLLGGFAAVFFGFVALYFWLLRRIAALEYYRGYKPTSALLRREVPTKENR